MTVWPMIRSVICRDGDINNDGENYKHDGSNSMQLSNREVMMTTLFVMVLKYLPIRNEDLILNQHIQIQISKRFLYVCFGISYQQGVHHAHGQRCSRIFIDCHANTIGSLPHVLMQLCWHDECLKIHESYNSYNFVQRSQAPPFLLHSAVGPRLQASLSDTLRMAPTNSHDLSIISCTSGASLT